MDDNKIISNLEGLRNPTILQQLEAMRKYVETNAVKGDKGAVGIFTVNADYVAETQYYAVTAVRNYVPEQFVGQAVYFNNGYIGIVAQVYDSTPVASPAFTVSNVISTKGEKGDQGEPGQPGQPGQPGTSPTVDKMLSPTSTNPLENKVIYNNLQNLTNEINDAKSQILDVSEKVQDLQSDVNTLLETHYFYLYKHSIRANNGRGGIYDYEIFSSDPSAFSSLLSFQNRGDIISIFLINSSSKIPASINYVGTKVTFQTFSGATEFDTTATFTDTVTQP